MCMVSLSLPSHFAFRSPLSLLCSLSLVYVCVGVCVVCVCVGVVVVVARGCIA